MKKRFHANFFAGIFFAFGIFEINAARQHQECQDVIVNNVVVQPGLSDCQRYYDAIKPILDRYKRSITVLDLGAGQGYFSFRIANDYDSTCVMVEDNSDSFRLADQLLELCNLNSHLKNILLLNKKMSLHDLQKLADCEHFDVVLAFDYINHKDLHWKKKVNEILRMGDNIFIQTPWSSAPSENDATREIVEFLAKKRSGQVILQTPCAYESEIEDQMFWFERNKSGLRCKCFGWGSKDSYMNKFRINGSYTHKTFLKKGSLSGPEWKTGINLVTFLMLNGTYPTKESIKQVVAGLIHEKLTDFTPWNLIIQGNNIELIDQSDNGIRVDVRRSLKYINAVVDQPSAQGMKKLLKESHEWHIRKRK